MVPKLFSFRFNSTEDDLVFMNSRTRDDAQTQRTWKPIEYRVLPVLPYGTVRDVGKRDLLVRRVVVSSETKVGRAPLGMIFFPSSRER